jgi:hypothetical protein
MTATRWASLDQIVAGRDGRMWEVSGEAGSIAKEIEALDPSLSVHFNDGGTFVVVQEIPEGPRKGQYSVVARIPWDQWDRGVVKDFQMRAHEMRHGISPIDRIEKQEAAWQAAKDKEYEEQVAEYAYPLMREMQRKILGHDPKSFRKVKS